MRVGPDLHLKDCRLRRTDGLASKNCKRTGTRRGSRMLVGKALRRTSLKMHTHTKHCDDIYTDLKEIVLNYGLQSNC